MRVEARVCCMSARQSHHNAIHNARQQVRRACEQQGRMANQQSDSGANLKALASWDGKWVMQTDTLNLVCQFSQPLQRCKWSGQLLGAPQCCMGSRDSNSTICPRANVEGRAIWDGMSVIHLRQVTHEPSRRVGAKYVK